MGRQTAGSELVQGLQVELEGGAVQWGRCRREDRCLAEEHAEDLSEECHHQLEVAQLGDQDYLLDRRQRELPAHP